MEEQRIVEKRDSKGIVDKYLSKLISRKLLVWGTATCALFFGIVPSEDWISICLMYIGSQGVVDMINSYYSAKNSD